MKSFGQKSNGNRFSTDTRGEFIDLVCAGIGLTAAAGVVGASYQSGVRWWQQSGGMKLQLVGKSGLHLADPVLDDELSTTGRRLSRADRAAIQFGRRQGLSYAAIGAEIGRDKSVVWREVQRNSGPDGVYYGLRAHVAAHQRARRPKPFKLSENPGLCVLIEKWMDDGWSPKLISLVLAKDFADDQTMQVSHETIYQALYVQTRGKLRADLNKQLSLKRRSRVPRTRDRRESSPYKEAFKISQRPAEVADRAVPGHWEGDLIVGPGSASAIGTLVERTTRFTILLHLPGGRHTADVVAEAMIAAMRDLPEHLRQSITWDRGTELADYQRVQLALDATLFFADPHSPWQRGTNENTNRLLRHWFTKGTDLSVHTAADIARAQATLNKRPRPTLGLDTPAQRLEQLIRQEAA